MRRASTVTRREFSAALAAATLAACARRAPAVVPAPAPSPAPDAAVPAPSAPATPADPNAPLADALLTVVAARYGPHIADAQRASVRTDILNALRTAQRVRGATLTNANGPFSVCAPPPAATATSTTPATPAARRHRRRA